MLVGISLAAVLLVLANQLRLGVIAGLVMAFGLEQGYQWGHLIVGSLISIVFLGLSAAIVIFVVATGYRGKHEEEQQ